MDDATMTGRGDVVELRALAQRLVVLHEAGDRGQVSIAGTAVGWTDGLCPSEVVSAGVVLRAAIAAALLRVGVTPERAEAAVARLVRDEVAAVRHRILIAGCSLVGEEPAHLATDRARQMVEIMTAEFERALADDPPVTVRQSAAERS